MAPMTHLRIRPFVFAAVSALLLTACGGATENSLAAIDADIAKADIDPAISGAIEDEILVDPTLVGQANVDGVRPPARPLEAPYPGRASAAAPGTPINSPCGVPFQPGNEWADRLPAEFGMSPGARITEAAGADRGDCHVRVVSFATDQNWEQVLDHYRGAAQRAGFDAEHELKDGEHMLGGTGANDGAYLVIVSPQARGSNVSLIINRGR